MGEIFAKVLTHLLFSDSSVMKYFVKIFTAGRSGFMTFTKVLVQSEKL